MLKPLAAALLLWACSPHALSGQSASIPVTLTIRPAAEARGDTVTLVVSGQEGVSTRSPAAPRASVPAPAPMRRQPQPSLPAAGRHRRAVGPGALSRIDTLLPFVAPGTLQQVTAGRMVIFVVSPNS